MTLADTKWASALQADRPITLRQYSKGYHPGAARHQFVGTLMVPKKLDDGSYPLVDVWTRAMDEVVITPYSEELDGLPKLYIGASELNHLTDRLVSGKRLLHIDTARGVEPVGYGFGFALYMATALAAKFAGPDGIYSLSAERSIDASELWERMKRISFGPMQGSPVKEAHKKMLGGRVDYILGQSVLDSGLVTRIGTKHGRPWASFRKPPTTDFAYGLKYRAKTMSPAERYYADA